MKDMEDWELDDLPNSDLDSNSDDSEDLQSILQEETEKRKQMDRHAELLRNRVRMLEMEESKLLKNIGKLK